MQVDTDTAEMDSTERRTTVEEAGIPDPAERDPEGGGVRVVDSASEGSE